MTPDPAVAPHRGPPLPLLGPLIGVAILSAAAIAVPRFAPPLSLGLLVGAGVAAGLVFWLVALATGLRRGPAWWTAASLALLLTAGALAGLNSARIARADTSVDASTFAELKLNPDGTAILPSSPARGPISAAYVELVRADEAAAKAWSAQVAKLNTGVLNSPYMLNQAPEILRDCAAIGTLESAARQASNARAARVARLEQAMAAATLPDPVKQGITMIVTPPAGATDALLRQEGEMWQATQALCELLAKRSWSNANGFFGFATGADKAAFDALNQRRVAVEAERKRIRDGITVRFEEGREKVRAALS
ncbi:hypothetical protein [Sphingomonas turrisvirgatae]|uniref:Uncharacterized protein n=1 Tax=Sphingomonas turrisvirgatae TaxID=1888892 RepID=A0A1E3LV76_9SPHN|nr:hypothetical protein [Sphingomonas turrisvirgatae]ODP37644.1 hypothetical protein BFL28_16890 [Sphingomonas turrisvirgatae]